MIDHLVLASPDPLATRSWLAEATGVELGAGGPHVGLGTTNWLGTLDGGPSGGGTYLELIGPDPDQAEPEAPRPFGIDDLTEARLVTWCSRQPGLAALRSRLAGVLEVTEPSPMQRQAPAGLLSWELAFPLDDEGGVVPFFIDWLDSPHPSTVVTPGLSLASFTLVHPDPDRIAEVLATIGDDVPVEAGDEPALRAELRGPAGAVVFGA